MNGRTLAKLMRLRQLQHESAKGALLGANDSRRAAKTETERREEILRSLQLPDRSDASTWLAITASRTSAALAVMDSAELVRISETRVDGATADWARARAAARGMERLEEMHRERVEHDRLAAEQREMDDRSATAAVASARSSVTASTDVGEDES